MSASPPEEYLGKIWVNDRWMDYARGYEGQSVEWQQANPTKRRVVHWITGAEIIAAEHVNYPHEPGTLYDCPACEAKCHCRAGESECVFGGVHTEG